jgi:hypothetical protein
MNAGYAPPPQPAYPPQPAPQPAYPQQQPLQATPAPYAQPNYGYAPQPGYPGAPPPPYPGSPYAPPGAFPVGARVLVQWADGNRYPGVVQQIAPGQSLVGFHDGQQRWVENVYLSSAP